MILRDANLDTKFVLCPWTGACLTELSMYTDWKLWAHGDRISETWVYTNMNVLWVTWKMGHLNTKSFYFNMSNLQPYLIFIPCYKS